MYPELQFVSQKKYDDIMNNVLLKLLKNSWNCNKLLQKKKIHRTRRVVSLDEENQKLNDRSAIFRVHDCKSGQVCEVNNPIPRDKRQALFSKVQITRNTLMRTWRTQIGEKFIFASSTKEAAFAKHRAEICSTLLS